MAGREGPEGPEGHEGDEDDEGLACETICPDIIWQKSIDYPWIIQRIFGNAKNHWEYSRFLASWID